MHTRLSELKTIFEIWLNEELSTWQISTELLEIAKFSLLAQGKRIRPILAMAAAESYSIEVDNIRPFALALEFLHTSSLIHDDLPCLDNDDFRRGQESCHKKYGEARALITGDLLLSRSFELIAMAGKQSNCLIEHSEAVKISGWQQILSSAAVAICDGQGLDICDTNFTLSELENLHRKKTAALIKAAVLGVCPLLGEKFLNENNCSRLEIEQKLSEIQNDLGHYGSQLGLLFQIVDDILDAETETGSKSYVALLGQNGARKRVKEISLDIANRLKSLGLFSNLLQQISNLVSAQL